MPLPRSLVHLKWENSEKKWPEVWQWSRGQTSKKKYRMPRSQRLDGTMAGGSKRLASSFYRTKTGYCLTGQYRQWVEDPPTAQHWW